MMKLSKIILFILTPVMLVLMVPGFLSADSMNQITPEDYETPSFSPYAPGRNGEIPSIGEGAPHQFPFVTTPPESQMPGPRATDQLAIDVWYGDTQKFSELGSPQLWANILGTVTGLDPNNPSHSLSYTINGGSELPLNIGSDKRRLYEVGDFNIELAVGELKPLPDTNIVVITADDGETVVTKQVTVEYVPGTTWPMPYVANFSEWGGNVQKGAQIVDGRWSINGSGNLILDSAAYDRLVAIGDYSWQDYEAVAFVTVKEWNYLDWGNPSNGGGIGMVVRWRGHYQMEGEQPRLGWSNLGALAWYRWEPKTDPERVEGYYEMLGYGGQRIASRADMPFWDNTTYWFKLSVQSSPIPGQPSTYRFKIWPVGENEPAQWTLSAQGVPGDPPSGSVLLVAHQVIAEFGFVAVASLPQDAFTITKLASPNGTIHIFPEKPKYSYGEKVQIWAEGNNGYKMSGWTGNVSGGQNPVILEMGMDVTVGANFSQASPPPELNISTVGNGTVIRDAQPPYRFGQRVKLTPSPQPGYLFAGWGGDLTGNENPTYIILDSSKNVTANFASTSTTSPQSDDFNVCELDTDLWTFINPVGDGSMITNGTELLLTVPAGVAHDIWGVNNSARVMQPTQNGSFEIEAKFDSVVNQRYQTQGIVVEQDANNYMRFDTHYDGAGVRIFAAKFVDGTPSEIVRSDVLAATPSYLRVTRVGNQWTYSFSSDGTTWTTAVANYEHTMNVVKTGVFAANQKFGQEDAPAHTAIVDYFFNTSAPIVPEDGFTVGAFKLQVDKVGQGTVSVAPVKQTYECFDSVTLTASPADGWLFTGWSGDLSGASPQQTIVFERDYSVVANFSEENVPPPNHVIYFPMTIRTPSN